MSRDILFLDESEDSKEACKLFPEVNVQHDDEECPTLITEDGIFTGIESIRTYSQTLENKLKQKGERKLKPAVKFIFGSSKIE